MKRLLCVFLAAALILSAGCALAQSVPKGYKVLSNPGLGYSTLVPEGCAVLVSDTASTVYLGTEGMLPYVNIMRHADYQPTDLEAFFNTVVSPALTGINGVKITAHATYDNVEMGGRQVAVVETDFSLSGSGYFAWSVLLREGKDSINFTGMGMSGEGNSEEMFSFLEDLIRYFQPDASYYGSSAEDSGVYQVYQASPVLSGTAVYKEGRFSLSLPKGWKCKADGDYSALSFRAWDPDKPERSIWMLGGLETFWRNETSRRTASQLGEEYGYYPVLDPCTVANLAARMEDLMTLNQLYDGTDPDVLPEIYAPQVLENWAYKGSLPDGCEDVAVVRFLCTSSRNEACEGLLFSQIYTFDTDYSTIKQCVCYNTVCILAPRGELQETAEVLAGCLGSFSFDEQYVNESMLQSLLNGTEYLENGKILETIAEFITDKWHGRRTDYDIQSQRYYDSARGYERLYDSQTGEIYLAVKGFYDTYSRNRYAYSLTTLYRIDDSSSDRYLQGVDYYITR